MANEKSNTVELGCWTLILIAVIVMIFSGRSNVGDLKQSVQELNKQIIVLQGKVDALSQAVQKQQGTKLESGQQPIEQPLSTKPNSR